MLDIRDWRPDLGEFGKLHVRFGKGSRGRGAEDPAGAGDQRSATCWTGGWPRCATSSATTGPTRTRRCCPASAATGRPGRCCRVRRPGAARRAWPTRSSGGCRPGRAADAARAAALLRLVAVCPRAWTSRRSRNCSATSGCRPRPATSTSTPTTSSRRGRAPTTVSPPGSAREGGETDALEPADEGRRARHLEVDRDAPPAGRGRAGDQRREDVGAVDRHPDHDPARRPGRDLRGAGVHARRTC